MTVLGVTPEPPPVLCAWCWPSLITATVRADGLPCCLECAALPSRPAPTLPRFVLKQWESP